MNKKNLFFIFIKILIIVCLSLVIFFFISSLIVGEKKELKNNYISFDEFFTQSEHIYLSKISSEFEKYLNNQNINFNNTNFIFTEFEEQKTNENVLYFSFYEKANKDFLYKLKQDITKKFGGNFDLLNNISIKNSEQDILFMFLDKQILLDMSFDFNEERNCWGINESSDSSLVNLVDINYFKSDKNYSISLKDTEDNIIIFMKNNDFKSYKEAWEYYLEHKNILNEFVYGEDSVCFKVLELNQIGLIPELTNYKKESLDLQNYYVSINFNLNGLGKNSNNNQSLLDQSKIKYNFTEDTILFIMKEGDLRPFFAYKY